MTLLMFPIYPSISPAVNLSAWLLDVFELLIAVKYDDRAFTMAVELVVFRKIATVIFYGEK